MRVRRRPFGRSGREISEIGFGCGGYWGYPVFPERDALRILEAAVEAGVDFLDTGPNYSNGNAEARLGRFLAAHRRDDLVFGTKVGSRLTPSGRSVKDFTPAGMRAHRSGALKRRRATPRGIARLVLAAAAQPAIATISAFCACSRFSACSKMAEFGSREAAYSISSP